MLTFIPTPIGNPQDITIRAMKLFEKAELFLCEDTRETKRLLKLLEERFEMLYPHADFISFNEHNGHARLEEYGEILESKNVVYVSDAGMPVISDPGQILVAYCQEKDIEYDVLPGASAVTTAYAASGFEEGKFLFYAFLPHKGKERTIALAEAMDNGFNTVLYESPHRLEKLLEEIAAVDGERELFLAKELTKKYQRYYRGSAKELDERLKNETIRGEWVVVISAKKSLEKSLSFSEVLSLDLPPKPKAKLLSMLSGKSVKEWYQELIKT
ncbi:16S rRNA (cytidine(1402)-2'-O)-methyltransferase [Sulfurovum mangrovi]|uniref:16S rRNA (cytidine(1402)-2'-O)-methyltransferase n=1 Tax=Sulfurovum mangrovi TaxID=2893889 RepID=UPI001E4D9D80|nr:16S rRNA (cytidine(1402)-2'-O)-methyltransferase [Sulfurovum mangrovi]UFH59509.1 16S rRNA (cytidine(1402)-2'-O)-methyltransferase [Sulfurovum mangrovi]UFH60661.1 16S rRNA (cytidine(1402)-2'-O)-methyltransferase [Sulfurovum mangrovi]